MTPDRTDSPEYQRLYEALHQRLAAQEWPVGAAIPSISSLQEQYGIASLGTVRRAQQMLVDQGYLRTQRGKGAFVVAHPDSVGQPQDLAIALRAIDEAARALRLARETLARHLA